MAIKIPSKNIYEMNNPKIRDNVIDNVSVEQTVVTPNNEYRKVIQTKQFDIKIEDCETKTDEKLEGRFWTPSNASPNWRDGIAYSKINAFYYKNKIEISKDLIKNNIITKLYDKRDGNRNSNIGYSIAYDQYDGISTANYSVVNAETITYRIYNINNEYNDTPTKSHIGKIEKLKVETTNDLNALGISNPFTAIAELVDETNLSTLTIREYENYFEFDFNVLVGKEEVSITGYSENGKNNNASGTCIKYIPKQLEITIYGDTIGIDLTDGSVTYGSGNKPHSLSGNELMQDSLKSNGILATKHLAENVLSQYKNGKESATLLCDINDYYFYENPKKKAISPYSANYIEFPYNGKVQENGILFTVLEDGGICLNGQNNGQGNSAFWLYNNYYASGGKDNKIFNKGTYTFSELGNNVKFVLWNDIGYFSVGGKAHTFAEDTKPRALYIEVSKGTQTIYDNYIIYPMMALNGEKPFEIGYPMFFKEHDEVIPMVLGANGKDYPMSKHQDGTPKVFEVVNTNLIYDGAVWQELILLEKSK